MPELGPYGSVRGALSNERPYRDLRNVVANYPFERSHRFAGIQPNSGHRDPFAFGLQRSHTQLGPGASIPQASSRTRLDEALGAPTAPTGADLKGKTIGAARLPQNPQGMKRCITNAGYLFATNVL